MQFYGSSHNQRCCVRKVLKISQNSEEKTCARASLLMKLQVSGLQTTASVIRGPLDPLLV